ncbi:MAG: ABC transporter ATP-binding protein [Bordetella sp.]|uniref:ABC transporter ATP-binding protein n=1 Tax=Bordetella sp. TaxID=28081 RepID=UPI003F7BD989
MLLECKGITAGYSRSPVLQDIDFAVDEGEIVTLVGANGAGKSSLVKTISGLLRPMRGELWYLGERIDSLPTAERLRRGICHVPEGRQVFSGMTVAENLSMGAYVRRAKDKASVQQRLEELVNQYPFLRERLSDAVGNFSGGQQQILAIVRGLMSQPKLIMLDEPSLGLSPMMIIEVFDLVKELRAKGHSILLSEQNAYAALAIADRGYVIENGRVTMTGKASDLLASSEIAERYLGAGSSERFETDTTQRTATQIRACIDSF